MTSLLIDIGNSYLKWALNSEQGFVFGGSCRSAPESIDVLFTEQFEALKPDNVFVACVAEQSIQQKFLARAKSSWDIDAELLVSPARGCGITNAYVDYTKLGSDRWAAMVAAFARVRGPVCVVSCGTALTVDVVAHDGEHLGGHIIPGYGLMQASLQQGTRMNFTQGFLPTVQFDLGQSTDACIQSGVAIAISSFVNTTFKNMQSRLPGLELILTGGGAEQLHNQLACESSVEQYLVLNGLEIIYCTCAAMS